MKNTRYAALFRVHFCAYTRVYLGREGGEKHTRAPRPDPGGFSLAPLQNVGGLLYFRLVRKEAKGLCCPVSRRCSGSRGAGAACA